LGVGSWVLGGGRRFFFHSECVPAAHTPRAHLAHPISRAHTYTGHMHTARRLGGDARTRVHLPAPPPSHLGQTAHPAQQPGRRAHALADEGLGPAVDAASLEGGCVCVGA